MTHKLIVNGEEVEYLHIEKKMDGSTEVTFSKKFNLATAHMSEIMKRVRQTGLDCVVSVNHKHNLAMISYHNPKDINGILHSLEIPQGSYEIDYDFGLITVQLKLLDKGIFIEEDVKGVI